MIGRAGHPRGVVRPMTAADVEPVRAWRNHPAIRAAMFTQHEIGAEESRRWFETAQADPRRHLLIYELDGRPSGFASLACRSDTPGIADWGFYVAPELPRGHGTGLCAAVLDHAFGVLGLHAVHGAVLDGNTRSLRLHEKLGFRRIEPTAATTSPAPVHYVLTRDGWRAAAAALSSAHR